MSLIGTRCLLCSCISNLKLMLSEKFSIVRHVPLVLKMDTFDNELAWNSDLGECYHFNHLCYRYRRCRGRRFSSYLELGKSFQSFLHPLPSNHIYFIFRACAFSGLPSLINILPLSFFAPIDTKEITCNTQRTKQRIQNIRQTDAREQFISVSRF